MRISDSLARLIGAVDPNCPDEDALFAYFENNVPPDKRARFERHFAGCADCRELLALVARESDNTTAPLTEAAVTEQTNRVLGYIRADERIPREPIQKARSAGGFYISYPRLASAGLVMCVIAIAAIFLLTSTPKPADAAMDALKLAVKDARYTEARVSGGLAYSTYASTRGGGSNDDDMNFNRAIDKLKPAEQENGSLNDKLVLARVYLARGKHGDAKHALVILNQLAARGVETREALNDTGVAELQLDHYDAAIEYFSRALAKSPILGEALFNRALAEERAHSDSDAARDWREFIDQSPDDNWKIEARSHLKSLSGATDH
jgi:tetratricopeptide (TPR) repeat protein